MNQPHWPAWALAIYAAFVVASGICFVLLLGLVAFG